MFGNGGINEIEGDDGDDMLYAGVDAAGTLIGGMGIDSFNNVNLAMDYDPLVDIDSAPYEIWT